MQKNKRNNKKTIENAIFIIIFALLIFLCYFIPCKWISISIVNQSSMCDTLYEGDVLITDRLATPNKGDVVVFKYDENNDYIKRIIAVGGETVYNDSEGNVWIDKNDGSEPSIILEDYVKVDVQYGTKTYKNYLTSNRLFRFDVPSDCFFVMGDNRVISKDSRDFGCIKSSQVTGVVHQFWIDAKKVTTFMFAFRR